MHDIVILIVKGLAGGALVLAFALLCQGLSPKRFAGLFSAAPSVAIAGLAITLLDKGSHEARADVRGMIAGAVAMVVFALVVIPLLRRLRAARAAAVALGAWALAAATVAVPVLLG